MDRQGGVLGKEEMREKREMRDSILHSGFKSG